ncbi:hypothetical protein CCP2SC5_770016 [Azospirillaceae bacterium]
MLTRMLILASFCKNAMTGLVQLYVFDGHWTWDLMMVAQHRDI